MTPAGWPPALQLVPGETIVGRMSILPVRRPQDRELFVELWLRLAERAGVASGKTPVAAPAKLAFGA